MLLPLPAYRPCALPDGRVFAGGRTADSGPAYRFDDRW